jgi:hypothetical protein
MLQPPRFCERMEAAVESFFDIVREAAAGNEAKFLYIGIAKPNINREFQFKGGSI